MKINRPITLSFLICAAASLTSTSAQSPTPLVVQAASPATATTALAAPASPAASSVSLTVAIRSLGEIKAINTETLKRQEATLEKLDELQKAADQLRIFAHRSGG